MNQEGKAKYLRKKENNKQDLDRNQGTGSPGGMGR